MPPATGPRREAPWDALRDPVQARQWLAQVGVRDEERGYRDLCDLAGLDLKPETSDALLAYLGRFLPRCSDAGMALTNLERFLAAGVEPEALARVVVGSPRTVEVAIQLFSTSQYFSELMIRDPGLLAWLRGGTDRLDPGQLVDELWSELQTAPDDESARLSIRRYRRRELLRIGYNDIVRAMPLEIVTRDLSHLAEACVEAAYRLARKHADERHGPPAGPDSQTPARFVVLALGKLGGEELNYSSDIDLIFLYDVEGMTRGPRVVSNAEYFARLGGELVRLLADHTSLGLAYRVDMRLRPEGDQGPLARSLAGTLGYYETSGRTWERQALIKCRAIAGDLSLGRDFLGAIEPFVYRRYLSGSEIGEIKTMKRRIEQRTLSAGTSEVEVKTGHGGIRDVEFVVQFLQLLHGGEYPDVRHANTLVAMSRLEQVGCLTAEERGIMEDTYRFLRLVEHRLQVMFDRQTHEMPRHPEEQRTLAIRLGYPPENAWEDRTGPAQRFLVDYRAKTELNRKILNHLLHDAFRGDEGAAADPVVDLVLDPEPDAEQITAALARFPFRDRETAYHNLLALAREDSPFLSQARCRHFLAAIAPRLLQAVSRAPDPDMALTNLEKVSASLGAKAILWELFNFNPPTLRLYVDLCSTSQFLSEILINNPGMIDDLMDSLVDDRSQPAKAIKAELAELCRAAEDLAPILTSFRNKEWVRIGTRDILGREPIRDVTRELADVADAVVVEVAKDTWSSRAARFGQPRRASDGRRLNWAIVGLGKLGGRELNYHSDLDLVFLYDEDGTTRGGGQSIPSAEFVVDVARRMLKTLGHHSTGLGLYSVDTRLRPHGASGPLAVTLDAFARYFQTSAQVWERLALTRARVVYGTGDFGFDVAETIRASLGTSIEPESIRRDALAMRSRLEESAPPTDLKRGLGGVADIEFIVQTLSLLQANGEPLAVRPNVWDALEWLKRASLIPREAAAELRESYDFYRTVESRLRLVQNRSTSEWPNVPAELEGLVRRLGYHEGSSDTVIEAFRSDAARHAQRTRRWFESLVGPLRPDRCGSRAR
jgi:[glutamine synthetase] adenylyltransferase / [glutamine synthetase]-adenylyl-L-tyrosine phosphorylase